MEAQDTRAIPMLRCDECGGRTIRPAIDLGLRVFCARCAPRHGMGTGEHGPARSYQEWIDRAQALQERIDCDQCKIAPAITKEWGPWLCAACSDSTMLGDGGADA